MYASKESSALRGRVQEGKPFSNFAFALERAACAIFGLATFGVHLTGKSWAILGPAKTDLQPTRVKVRT